MPRLEEDGQESESKDISSHWLVEKVWAIEFMSDHAIRVCVWRRRLKLGDVPQGPRIIRSHGGMDYSSALPR